MYKNSHCSRFSCRTKLFGTFEKSVLLKTAVLKTVQLKDLLYVFVYNIEIKRNKFPQLSYIPLILSSMDYWTISPKFVELNSLATYVSSPCLNHSIEQTSQARYLHIYTFVCCILAAVGVLCTVCSHLARQYASYIKSKQTSLRKL